MQEIFLSPFIKNSGELWVQATESAFLNGIEDGTLPPEAFQRWLVQDYHFVKGLIRAQCVMAAKTPRPLQKTLIQGLAAMNDELDWFEANAEAKGYRLNVEKHPICQRYVDFLIASAYGQPVEVNLAIIFAVEVAYLAGWSALPAQGPFAEYIQRWSTPEFAAYVNELQKHAEENPNPQQQKYCNLVLAHERDFWRMTMDSKDYP